MNNAAIEEIRKRSAENKTVDDYRRMPVSEIAKMRLDIKRLLKAIDAPLQVVHGRWETVKKGSSMHHKCNNCGFSAGVGRKYNEFMFCPNCGAKMDGGVEDAAR